MIFLGIPYSADLPKGECGENSETYTLGPVEDDHR